MIKNKLFAALLLVGLSCVALDAKTIWKLNSGESFTGDEISRNDKTVLIKLPYGTLDLNISDIASQDAIADKSPQLNSNVATISNTNKHLGTRSYSTTGMTRTILNRQPPELQTTTMDALNLDIFKEEKWVKGYKDFMQDLLPENTFIKFRIGYANVVTNSDRSALDMGMSVEKSWEDIHELFFYGFYNYAKETYKSTDFENISVNKYGAGGEYTYAFLGKDSGVFAITAMDYKTDNVKFIDVMTDNMIGLGYDFKAFNKWGIDFDIAIGPGVRYSQYTASPIINGNDTYFMGYARQSLVWRISKNFKIEERFIYALDMAHLDSWEQFTSDYYEKSTYLSIGLVYSPSDIFSIALRYYYDFDAENNLYKDLKNSYAEDSRFIISFEIPIGWRQ